MSDEPITHYSRAATERALTGDIHGTLACGAAHWGFVSDDRALVTCEACKTALASIGTQLTEARKRLGWTLRDAERATGVPNGHISQIETGAIADPGIAVVGKLARAYGMNPGATAVRLLEEAMHLRTHGERAPGGNETWREWDAKTEMFLRGLHDERI